MTTAGGATVAALGAVILILVAIPQGGQAHASVTVGPYTLIIGWTEEPALAGNLNKVVVGIRTTYPDGSFRWIEDAEGNLTAKLLHGSSTFPLDLVPVFGEPGWYAADVVPTVPGNYTLNLTGTVEAQAVAFNQAMDEVGDPASLEFPSGRTRPEEARLWALVALGIGGAALAAATASIVMAFLNQRRHR